MKDTNNKFTGEIFKHSEISQYSHRNDGKCHYQHWFSARPESATLARDKAYNENFIFMLHETIDVCVFKAHGVMKKKQVQRWQPSQKRSVNSKPDIIYVLFCNVKCTCNGAISSRGE